MYSINVELLQNKNLQIQGNECKIFFLIIEKQTIVRFKLFFAFPVGLSNLPGVFYQISSLKNFSILLASIIVEKNMFFVVGAV